MTTELSVSFKYCVSRTLPKVLFTVAPVLLALGGGWRKARGLNFTLHYVLSCIQRKRARVSAREPAGSYMTQHVHRTSGSCECF